MGKLDSYDSFGIESMTEAEHAAKQEHVQKLCKCAECPTYVEGDSPIGYCFPLVGTSKKIQWEKECICSTCEIYSEFELNHNHYCTRCSHLCQSIKTLDAGSSGGN